jgi:hypothetical protein
VTTRAVQGIQNEPIDGFRRTVETCARIHRHSYGATVSYQGEPPPGRTMVARFVRAGRPLEARMVFRCF